ncbi:MAG: CRISPR-associated protein Cas5 [Clostridiales bacterium]|nr:CRISPR-associated protein Cas5 [Clostridiales bacterium]
MHYSFVFPPLSTMKGLIASIFAVLSL